MMSAVLCLGFAAHATSPLMPVEPTGPDITDASNENSPHEVFPLLLLPIYEPMARRTELPNPERERAWRGLKTKILNDFAGRMSSDFKIPSGLRERTEFWFDIYTKYGEAHHIIHHLRFPWIIFKVVDTTETLANGKGPLWLRHDRASKLAKQQASDIRNALKRLASKKDFSKLSPLEKDLYDKLLPLPGSRKSVFLAAAANVRSQLGQKDFFQRGLVNSSRYLPYMEEAFYQVGLPVELTRMPFVESSFNEDARSKVGASGIWQIMPATGKAYMNVNELIDERNSPLKATVTAAKLLRGYYHELGGSWPLTITSYNHGIGNIHKAIKKAESRDLATIIARYHQGDFRFASSNFFTCFLAALYAEKYHELIFKEVPRQPLQETEIVRLTGAAKPSQLMKLAGIDRSVFLKYNMDLRNALRQDALIPRGFTLHLPPGYKDRLTQRIGVQDRARRPRT